MGLISPLLTALAGVSSSSTVSNPYSVAAWLTNLHAYLTALCAHPYSGHLFVGEAPGHRGCAITGIPFSSERVLRSGSHLFLTALLPSLTLAGSVTERSATIVWCQFAGKRGLPAFWNAFPFHPHSAGVTNDNRRPTGIEIAAGTLFLHTVVEILAPHTIVAVGDVAASVTTTTFPKLRHLTFPHPSYRGTAGFISGCAALNIP
jgi:uracil-DNA glycosylase